MHGPISCGRMVHLVHTKMDIDSYEPPLSSLGGEFSGACLPGTFEKPIPGRIRR